MWNAYLAGKYSSDDRLRQAWSAGETPGVRPGLRPDESLDRKNVRRVRSDETVTVARTRDFLLFLADGDVQFFNGMRQFLKDDLGVKASVMGTWVHGLLPACAQSNMDVVDVHSYWDHPVFPRKQWDPRDWVIDNTAMVDDPEKSTLAVLTAGHVARPRENSPARPRTVSEYDNPAPNDYQAEGIPMVASLAAAQDWDGVLIWDYGDSNSKGERSGAVRNCFNIVTSPVKMVQLAAGALLFRRADIAPLPVEVVTGLEPEGVAELSARYGLMARQILKQPEVGAPGAWRFFARYSFLPFAPTGGGQSVTRLIQPGKEYALPAVAPDAGTPNGPPGLWRSADGALQWMWHGPGSGLYSARGERSMTLVGFVGGELGERMGRVGPVRITVQSPRFAAITLSALDGKPLREARRILITAAARQENTGQQWNASRTSVSDQWGHAPVLIEPVRAEITLERVRPAKGRLTALAADGSPLKEFPVEFTEAGLTFTLPGDPATLWYVLHVQ